MMTPPFHARPLGVLVLLAALAGVSMRAQSVSIDFVTVGYLGNASDPLTGLGSVSYEYQIGKYEVTNAQYAAFLNAAAKSDPHDLYNISMGADARGGIVRSGSPGSYSYVAKAGYENKAVLFVSWFDAARFVNWAATGDTEGLLTGAAYRLDGAFPPFVGRETGARLALPTWDEWYKAAYFDPLKGGTGGYWLYPASSDIAPTASAPTALPNHANFDFPTGDVTNVGSYSGSSSAFGTFDQGGNAWEWSESFIGDNRAYLGGSFDFWLDGLSASLGYNNNPPVFENTTIGFRVAQLTPIPEPSTYGLLAGLMSVGLAVWRRRATRGT